MPRLAVITSQFPCVDETFLIRDLEGLSNAGFELKIFSLKRSRQQVVQREAERFLPDTLSPPLVSMRIGVANVRALLRSPVRFLKALWATLMIASVDPPALVKCLGLFPQAVFLAERARELGIDALHAYWATYPAVTAAVIGVLLKMPFSMSAHAHDIFHPPQLIKRTIRRARLTITCTEQARELLLQRFPEIAPASIVFNYHGTRLDLFGNSHRAAPGAEVRILSVGTLTHWKGFDYLVAACAILAERGARFRCTLVGDGPEAARLRAMVSERRLEDRFEMLGALTQREIADVFGRSDVFVLPARRTHTGVPNVIVEALASGLPVIATQMEALGEIIESGTRGGLLIPFDHPEALAQAILKLAEDRALAARLAQSGRDLVLSKFDSRVTGPRLAGLLASPSVPLSRPARAVGGGTTASADAESRQ